MSDDFSLPQEYNVPIGERELADDTGARSMPIPPRLFDPPPSSGEIQAEANLYPVQRHGVRGPRMRPR